MYKTQFIYILLMVFLMSVAQGQEKKEISLMPVPQKVIVGDGKFRLDKSFMVATTGETDDRLYVNATRFLRRLDQRTGLFFKQQFIDSEPDPDAQIFIKTSRAGELKLGEDESYQLEISPQKISLSATTDLGALHGIETLLQLLSSDENGFYFPVVKITDSPRFPWRGIMIDVARHFLPIHVIKRNIDGMAAVKMNVLHLHLTDDQGFRIESKVYPQLHKKASEGLYFTQEEMKEIISYADERGIRVVPEFDVPGHASSWLVAFPSLSSASGSHELIENAGIFDPTLDPTNERTYEVLGNFFKEMAALFPDAYFHIGGDENEGKHWNSNPAIQKFMEENDIANNHELQAYFNARIYKALNSYGKKMMGWDEVLHPDVPKSTLIQSWRGPEGVKEAATQNHDVILSNGYYIDLMHSAAEYYVNDPLPENIALTESQKKHVLGGEATMWSELVTPLTVDSRIWPRSAAIAERLWSPAAVKDVADMYNRMEVISIQLEEHGLRHITSRDVILRNISNGQEIPALRTLADLAEPLEGYTRNPGGTMYTMYSPYTLFADATIADAPLARKFNALVRDYLQSPDFKKEAKIMSYLNDWKHNHQQIQAAIPSAPLLKSVDSLSMRLSTIASLGAEALTGQSLNKEAKNMKDAAWIKNAKEKIEAARNQGARTELQVVDAIEKLIMSKVNK